MKSWEYEKMIHDEAYESSYNLGYKYGYNLGFNGGINNAHENRPNAIDRINQLNILLTEVGRSEDIIKAARDKEYQEKLFEEFGL